MRFLDFLQEAFVLHPTKNICHPAAAFARRCLNDLAAMKRNRRPLHLHSISEKNQPSGFIFSRTAYLAYALTTVVDDRTIDSLYACWLRKRLRRARRRNGAPDRGLCARVNSLANDYGDKDAIVTRRILSAYNQLPGPELLIGWEGSRRRPGVLHSGWSSGGAAGSWNGRLPRCGANQCVVLSRDRGWR